MKERVQLGKSGLKVSPICFGCWQMGQTYWGKQPEDVLIRAVHTAFEYNVNFFDTADAYGDGIAEKILGKAIKELPRDKIIIATKVFHHFYPDGHRHPDLSKKYILYECEKSLERLGIDYIDLYQAHSYEIYTPMEEIAEAFEKLKREGKIRAYGVSNFTLEQLRLARKYGSFSTLQPYYNLLEPGIEKDLLPYCYGEKLGVLVYSPLLRGILTGKFTGKEVFSDLRANDLRFKGKRFQELVRKVEKLKPVAKDKGMSVTQLTLLTTLSHPAIHSAIVGIKNSAQIKEAAEVMRYKDLTLPEYYQVRSLLS
ncbi:aldo/keto reductase [Candidatus Aerophobetes bacterium]|nr:aldo/keto reductase [Candidatus Aerophobetes bacterium]